MKKAIVFILLFVILLSAVGCTDDKKNLSVEGSTSDPDKTEMTTDSFDVPVEKNPEEANQTNASSNQPTIDVITENESIATDASQDETALPDTTQSTNYTETNPPDQTSSTTAPETSSPADTQTTPSEDQPFVTGDDGVDLPINPF